jgi:hypothetical protein
MLQIALDGRIGGLPAQVLQVNRDLGTGNVDTHDRWRRLTAPNVGGQHIGGSEFNV